MKISEPGVYDMPADQYHGDPCDGPSLGSTGARELVNGCPASFRWKADNPEVKEEFDIGNATHLLVLEPDVFEAKTGRVPFDDYRKKEAQASRDDIRASGRIPLLPRHLEQIEGMRASLAADPIAQFAFRETEIERSMFWRDPEFGFWCKTRPDALPKSRRYLVDLKTSTSADPDDFRRAVVNFGYHQQAAWYLDGVGHVLGARPERFAFVVVAKTAPYLVSTCWLDEEAIGWGAKLNRYARGVFAWCLEHGAWPSFTPDITQAPTAFTISLPPWARRDLEERDQAGEFVPPQERIAA